MHVSLKPAHRRPAPRIGVVVLLERPSTSRIADIVGELLAEERCVILRASPKMYGAMAMNLAAELLCKELEGQSETRA